jgi:hypothetical protein
VDVEFRDPWSIMKQWICDPTLAPVSTWFSQEKYLCLNGTIDFANPLYDEPYTGETWRSVDVSSIYSSDLHSLIWWRRMTCQEIVISRHVSSVYMCGWTRDSFPPRSKCTPSCFGVAGSTLRLETALVMGAPRWQDL